MDKGVDASVSAFLERLRRFMQNEKLQIVNRSKFLQTLATLNMTVEDAREELFLLTEQEYRKGPERDYDETKPGHIWVFIRKIYGQSVYIKIKEKPDTKMIVISFHL